MSKDKRLFARLDLDYADHPKIMMLSDAAFRAHIEMILYSRKYLTDGFIPKRIAKRFGSDSVRELLANDRNAPSLIDFDDDSFLLHGYSDMNETRAEVDRKRHVNAENGRKGGLAKKRNASKSVSESLSEKGSENVAETETETETDIKEVTNVTSKKRGERISSDWKPLQNTVDTITDEYPALDYQKEHLRFVDYWIAQPGQKGVKLDWDATWRNWMRRKGDEQGAKPTPAERAHRTVALATDLLEVEA